MLNKESLQSSATSTAKSLLFHVSFSSQNTTLSLYQTKSGLTMYDIRQQPLPLHPFLELHNTFSIRLTPSNFSLDPLFNE